MDAFSEILNGVKLKGAVFFTAEFSAPCDFFKPSSNLAPKIAPEAEHLVLYHPVVKGGAVIELLDEQHLDLLPGDVVVFPHGHAHH